MDQWLPVVKIWGWSRMEGESKSEVGMVIKCERRDPGNGTALYFSAVDT